MPAEGRRHVPRPEQSKGHSGGGGAPSVTFHRALQTKAVKVMEDQAGVGIGTARMILNAVA